MSVRLLALVAVLALPALALAQDSYVRTIVPGAADSCLYWAARQIPWSPAAELGGALPEAVALEAVRLSFAEWEGQSCTDVQFVERAATRREIGYSSSGRNANAVLFRDVDCEDVVPRDADCRWEGGCGNEYDCWDFGKEGAGLIAVTTTTFSQCTGRIVDADIEFNAAHFGFTTGSGGPCGQGGGSNCVDTDLRNTLVHEIGHLLGFDHSSVNASTMYVTAQPGELEKRSLHDVDIAGLCDVYPAGEPTWICEPARPPAQCGESRETQYSKSGCASGGAGLALLGLVPGVLWVWRRRSP